MIEAFVSGSHIRLRFMREAFSINKKEFSRVLNANYRTYNEWEKKDITPCKKVLSNMIKIGLNPNYLNGADSIIQHGFTFDDVQNTIIQLLEKGS